MAQRLVARRLLHGLCLRRGHSWAWVDLLRPLIPTGSRPAGSPTVPNCVPATLFSHRHCTTASTSTSVFAAPRPSSPTYGTAPSHGTPAALAVARAAELIILPGVCDHLLRHGYAVVDGALDTTRIAAATGSADDGTALSEALRAELLALAATPGLMRPNATHLVSKDNTTVTLDKHNIFEVEVHRLGDDVLSSLAPTYRAVANPKTLNRGPRTLNPKFQRLNPRP